MNSARLNMTPRDQLADAAGQVYFVWDQPMTLERFESGLHSDDPAVRAHFAARLMRDARPDDVFQFIGRGYIVASWERIEPLLGKRRAFWTWLLGERWGWIQEPRA